MGDTGITYTSYAKVIKFVKKHGFELRQGGRHSIARLNDITIVIPRHTKISTGVTKQIVKLLVDVAGFDKDEVNRALKK